VIDFGSSQFDAKIGRRCRSDFAAENDYEKHNNIKGKRFDFIAFRGSVPALACRILPFAARSFRGALTARECLAMTELARIHGHGRRGSQFP
jgi:hypothetical protein